MANIKLVGGGALRTGVKEEPSLPSAQQSPGASPWGPRGGPVRAPAASISPTSSNLAQEVDNRLPASRFRYVWQRERILDRARAFEVTVSSWARGAAQGSGPLTAIQQLVGEGAHFSLQGVASHFGPETIQAHVIDADKKFHVYVRAGSGEWVEREDLANKVRAGCRPTADAGLSQSDDRPTNTFASAVVDAAGNARFSVPDLSQFDHSPRVRPFAVGQSVQIPLYVAEHVEPEVGKPYRAPELVHYGTIVDTDGRGVWEIQVTKLDGSPAVDDRGEKIRLMVDDHSLRMRNAPTLLPKNITLWDVSLDSNSPSQQRMFRDWHSTAQYQKIIQTRPGPGAPDSAWATWEKAAIDEVDTWLDNALRFPPLEKDLPGMGVALNHLHSKLASEGLSDVETANLKKTARALKEQFQYLDDYRELLRQALPPSLGDYYKVRSGECRQQAIAMQVMLQELGVDSRLVVGAVVDNPNKYRAVHMWLECDLRNGSQVLADPTWSDSESRRPSELRSTYAKERRRIPLPGRTNESGGYGLGRWLAFAEQLRRSQPVQG